MEKKETVPPQQESEGTQAGKGGRTSDEKHPKRVNRVPDYDGLFSEQGAGKKQGGFLRKIFRGNWGRLIVSSVLFVIKASPIWLMPLVTGDVIDTITTLPEGYVTRLLIDAAIFVAMLVQNIPMHMWYASITDRMIRRTTAGVKSSVIRKLQRLSITYHREMEGGKIQSKFLRDIDSIDSYFRNVVQVLIPNALSAVIAVVISLFKSPFVTLFFVLIVPLNVLNSVLFRKRMRKMNSAFRMENEKMASKLTTVLQMLTLTKAHGLETVETVEVQKNIDTVTKAGLNLDGTNAVFGSLTWVIGNLLSGLCLFFCVFLALKGYITVGEVVLFQSLFTSINGSVLTLINAYPALMSGRESVNSLSELMRAEDVEASGGSKVLPEVSGKVDFCHVNYRYPDSDKYVIRDFDLHVKQGECIAVVGSSGSGKSTVMNLLIGLLDPTEGKILIDGVPLTELSRSEYRHFISVVPQNSILFSGSIRENITYGLDRYSDEQLDRAVRDADITEFLPSFPNGLDTQVGEHGDKLSGGQKQRVCIARALIRNPRILIMDEATSALDNVSEYHVQKAIERLIRGSTTFIVAHRLSTIRNADRIVVMEEGVAVEIGTYDELMARGGRFCELEKLSRMRENPEE